MIIIRSKIVILLTKMTLIKNLISYNNSTKPKNCSPTISGLASQNITTKILTEAPNIIRSI